MKPVNTGWNPGVWSLTWTGGRGAPGLQRSHTYHKHQTSHFHADTTERMWGSSRLFSALAAPLVVAVMRLRSQRWGCGSDPSAAAVRANRTVSVCSPPASTSLETCPSSKTPWTNSWKDTTFASGQTLGVRRLTFDDFSGFGPEFTLFLCISRSTSCRWHEYRRGQYRHGVRSQHGKMCHKLKLYSSLFRIKLVLVKESRWE